MARSRLLLLTLLLGPAAACDGDAGRRPAGKQAAAAGKPIPVRAAATADTHALLGRLKVLLARPRPPLKLVPPSKDLGLEAVGRGSLDLLLDSHPQPDPKRSPRGTKPRVLLVGAETVAVLTNATNPIDRLSLGDLGRVLKGRVSNWKQVRGPRLPLIAYTLGAQSDLSALLRGRFTGGKPFDPSVRQVRRVDTLLESVRRTPGAIGLLATYQIPRPPPGKLTPPGIKMLALSVKKGTPGYLATDRAAASKGHYPLLLPVALVVGLPSSHPAWKVLTELLSAKMLQHLAVQLGLVPLPAEDRRLARKAWAKWAN